MLYDLAVIIARIKLKQNISALLKIHDNGNSQTSLFNVLFKCRYAINDSKIVMVRGYEKSCISNIDSFLKCQSSGVYVNVELLTFGRKVLEELTKPVLGFFRHECIIEQCLILALDLRLSFCLPSVCATVYIGLIGRQGYGLSKQGGNIINTIKGTLALNKQGFNNSLYRLRVSGLCYSAVTIIVLDFFAAHRTGIEALLVCYNLKRRYQRIKINAVKLCDRNVDLLKNTVKRSLSLLKRHSREFLRIRHSIGILVGIILHQQIHQLLHLCSNNLEMLSLVFSLRSFHSFHKALCFSIDLFVLRLYSVSGGDSGRQYLFAILIDLINQL